MCHLSPFCNRLPVVHVLHLVFAFFFRSTTSTQVSLFCKFLTTWHKVLKHTGHKVFKDPGSRGFRRSRSHCLLQSLVIPVAMTSGVRPSRADEGGTQTGHRRPCCSPRAGTRSPDPAPPPPSWLPASGDPAIFHLHR